MWTHTPFTEHLESQPFHVLTCKRETPGLRGQVGFWGLNSPELVHQKDTPLSLSAKGICPHSHCGNGWGLPLCAEAGERALRAALVAFTFQTSKCWDSVSIGFWHKTFSCAKPFSCRTFPLHSTAIPLPAQGASSPGLDIFLGMSVCSLKMLFRACL